MTFRQIVGALGVVSVVSVISVSPALAVSQPAKQAAKVAATPLAQKPEKQSVAPVATPVSRQAPVAAPVAPPAKVAQAPVVKQAPAQTQPVAPVQPVVKQELPEAKPPIASAPPPPVKKVDEGQKPVSTPAPVSVKSDKGDKVAAPVQRTVAPPVKVADAKQTDSLAKQAKDDDKKPLPANCSKAQITNSAITLSGQQAIGTFTVGDCTVTVTLATYEKHDSNIDHQTLYASVTDQYGQGTHVVTVNMPASCDSQIDLATGNVVKHFGTEGYYGDRKLAYTYNNGTGFCGEETPPPPPVPTPTPTPTPKPTETPTPVPTGTPTPRPTETPTPKPTQTPTPSPTTKPTPKPTNTPTPTPTQTPPVKVVTCIKGEEHPPGNNEICVPIKPYPCDLGSKPNKQGICQPVSTPTSKPPVVKPPVSKPPVVAPPVKSPKVTAPVSHTQRLVASKALAVQPTATATPIQKTPLAPNTGSGPSQLAATGSDTILNVIFALLVIVCGIGFIYLNVTARRTEENGKN